ncbi:MAG: DUF5329 domain-containing protein, partial [Woeseiaceae bacterium]
TIQCRVLLCLTRNSLLWFIRPMMMKMCSWLALGLFSLACAAAGPGPAAQEEIKHLLSTVERSGCEFFREGQWHNGTKARAHLQRKYDYLVRKGLVATSEEFIERAGSSSSITGKPYRIRCANSEPVPSAQWLSAQLRAYRKK